MNFDIVSLKRKMLVKYPFFGSVVAGVDYKEDINIGTAGTDGKIVYYNPKFLEGLSIQEQTFIFAHEICHIAFNHILRSEGKDSRLWNIATDAVINQFLKKDKLPIPKGGVDIAEAINYDAEELYEKLLQEKEKRENGNQNQNGSSSNSHNQQSQQQNGHSGGSSGEEQSEQQEKGSSTGGTSGEQNEHDETKEDVGHDTHSMWEDAVKKHKEEQKETDNNKNLLDKLSQKDEKDKDKSELEKKQEELQEIGEKDAFKKNLEEKKRELEELKKVIIKEASQAGNKTNGDIIRVHNIGTAKAIIDWRYILRETITYDVDWSYKNAYVEDGVVHASLEEQPMPETEIVLDTSGSINNTLLKNFLRECKNILQHTKLKVGCFDTKFYGFNEIRTEEDIENMRFQGGGGTDFDVAVDAFSRRVENKIVFTDGEASMPKSSIDAIWIVFGNRMINPKGGKVIYITNDELDRLYNFESNNIKSR